MRHGEEPDHQAASGSSISHTILSYLSRHGVHRRTVRQALAPPWPAPHKSYER
jgi:hypothetical protein